MRESEYENNTMAIAVTRVNQLVAVTKQIVYSLVEAIPPKKKVFLKKDNKGVQIYQ